MSRPRLSIARAQRRSGPPLSLVKKALRLFAGRGIPREVRHANARKWLEARMRMGERHILNREFEARWGVPGEPKVPQVRAPRRLGERA